MNASSEIVLRPDREGLLARSEDARDLLRRELEAPWAYVELPRTDPRLPQSVGPFTDLDDIHRVTDVDDWIDREYEGCVLAALRHSPLFVSIHPETGLMDGWHRLFVAQCAQLEVIPVILFDVSWQYGNGLGNLPKSYYRETAGGG